MAVQELSSHSVRYDMKDFFNKLPKLEIGLVVVFLILLLWGASGEASELDAEIFHASNAGS